MRSVGVCASACSKGCTGGRGQHADRHFPMLSGPISVWQVNGEHKTYLKATFTTWLIPLHCVISRCHISPPHVCLNALPSTLWLVSLGWLPQIHSSRAPHPFTSSLKEKNSLLHILFRCSARYQVILHIGLAVKCWMLQASSDLGRFDPYVFHPHSKSIRYENGIILIGTICASTSILVALNT